MPHFNPTLGLDISMIFLGSGLKVYREWRPSKKKKKKKKKVEEEEEEEEVTKEKINKGPKVGIN